MINPKVAIVIVNWNGKEHLSKCLPSVFRQTYQNYKVIVVDNGSADGSQDFIIKNFPEVRLATLAHNYGFAKGANIGMEAALRYEAINHIALLNTDTVVDKNWLSELVKVAETDNRIGSCAPKILGMDSHSLDSTGAVFKIGSFVSARGRGEADKGQYDEKVDIAGACGASIFYNRKMVEKVGLFDEDFFAYCEDTDLAWRAYKEGWKAKYVPTSVVYHEGGGSIKTEKLKYVMAVMSTRNWAVMVSRHANRLQKLLFTLSFCATGIRSWVGMRLGRNNIGAKPYILAFKEFFGG